MAHGKGLVLSGLLVGVAFWGVNAQTTSDLGPGAGVPTGIAGQPSCFPLAGTTTCTAWKDYTIQASSSFANLTAFDTYIQSLYDNTTTSLATFQRDNACPTWNGKGRRYHISFLCGMVLDVSTVNGCNPTNIPRPLCSKTAKQAVDSLTEIYADAKSCTPGVARPFPNTTETFMKRMTTDVDCVAALSFEWAMCGFWTDAEATAYCSAAATSSDLCCQAQKAKLANQPIVVPTSIGGPTSTGRSGPQGTTPGGTTSTSGVRGPGSQAQGESEYGKPSNAVIIGASVAGFVALVAVGAVLMVGRRKRAARQLPDGFVLGSGASAQDGNSGRKMGGGDEKGGMMMVGAMAPAAAAAANREGDVGEPIQIAETMEVIYNYVPNLSDEIYLYIGDPVIVKCKFDDGWGYGFNMTTKQEGSFPLACVAPYNSRDGGKNPVDSPQSSEDHWGSDDGMGTMTTMDSLQFGKRESSLGRFASTASSTMGNVQQPMQARQGYEVVNPPFPVGYSATPTGEQPLQPDGQRLYPSAQDKGYFPAQQPHSPSLSSDASYPPYGNRRYD
ncbi:hypothetical protein SpCBS45565_g01854 [Spizellomyces sp. 'palustris']|nr:hypothetical protein SpCBS45565_g01854 [Spizellomyces sp. 'palustris']